MKHRTHNDMRYLHRKIILFALLGTLVSSCGSLSRKPPPSIDFTGVWRMDHEVSGNPVTLPGITASAPRNTGLDPKGDAPGDLLGELRSQVLRIDQRDSSTRIIYDSGQMHDYDWGRAPRGEASAGWQKTYFVVRSPGPGGSELVRQFILSDAGKSLTVVTVFNKTGITQFYKLDKEATRRFLAH
jgi:hypothetical protein